ncbi:kinase-like domain-containing protein [Fusarium solani]|uniref:Kinase-like domain-containing protein n=1 Tax=Fusarium solani TaxID=169388 RepID=A0A9P9GU43_FUSSL|nr:kinase-like domain-containing protein [Fusarium solani]KAH7244802.1 kinase-like domain-containing protein [Fusarium solani]
MSRTAPSEDNGSATNPFSSGFFEAHLTSDHINDAARAEPAAREPLGAPIAIQDLSLSEIPAGAENARLVISPRGPPPLDDSEALVPFGHGELLAVLQSSKSAWFSLTLAPDLQCTFYYDPASDDLVLRSSSRQPIQIGPIQDDDGTSDPSLCTLEYRDVHLVSPGPWRIYSADHEVLVDFLVLRRRYLLETQTGGTQAGSKRKEILLSEAPAKRHRIEADIIDQSIVLISKPPNNPRTETPQLELVRTGNPLISLQPGQAVFLTAPGEVPPAGNHSPKEAGASYAQAMLESYSLLHMRDIASTKGFASVFSARHGVFGDTAVKVIRTKQASQYSYIPTMAQNWKHEEQILRKVKHPSIIRFFGSDARLYSIYMEHLPFPDLNAWRNRPHDHYFVGTADDAERILRDMASALEYLHGQNIQHNDIKPGNILYDRERGPVLIDFGLASSQGGQLCSGGTPWYVPREFIDNLERGPKSDVFALGVTMLYLLRRTPLPDTTQRGWIIYKAPRESSETTHMEAWLSKVVAMRSELDGAGHIESLVSDMLSPSPRDRKSAKEIVKAMLQE